MVILGVHLQVFGEIGNAMGDEANLHLWRTGIALMKFILINQFFLVFGFKNQFL